MNNLCEECGIQIPKKVMLWEFSINEEIQSETTEEDRGLFKTSSKSIIYTPYSAILKSFCEDCAKGLDLHDIWIPDKPNPIITSTISKSALKGDHKQTCLKCQECGDIILYNEPYWTILLIKGYYKYSALEFTENYVIHVYCKKCAEIKDFNVMEIKRKN